MKVRYTLRAFAERERIFEYLDARNAEAARAVVGLIKQRIEQLGEQPYKGRRTNRPGIYTLWITPYRYRVFYRIDDDEVVVIRIRHTSRRPWA
jgi:toxin ParE1/3/4